MHAVSCVQAALDQVKAQVKVMQRTLDEAQRNIAALQGILGVQSSRRNPVHTTQIAVTTACCTYAHSASSICYGML